MSGYGPGAFSPLMGGYYATLSSIVVTGGTVTMTTTQAAAQMVLLTGVLTSNATLIVPNTGAWLFANRTTGPFTIIVQTAAGTGLTVPQSISYNTSLTADGTNVTSPMPGAFTGGTLTGLLIERATLGIVANAVGTQAGGTALVGQVNQIVTAANASPPYASVVLPTAVAGLEVTVANTTSNPIQVYGAASDTINGVAATTGVTQVANSVDVYWASATGSWYVEGGVGFSGSLFTESARDGIAANATGTQASATVLTAQTNRVTTAANAVVPFASVLLPPSAPGLEVTVVNVGANPIQVFGAGADTINGVASATGVLQMQNSVDTYWSPVAGVWYAELGGGFAGPFLTENAQDAISAAGTTQAGATPIITQTARVTTVGAPVGGVAPGIRLPPSAAGLELVVINHGTNPMTVYGSGTDTIDDIAATVGVQQMVSSFCIFSCATAGQWYSNGIGTGYSGQFPTVSYTNNVTAFSGGGQTGPTQANGAQVGTAIFRVTTVAAANDSVRLPLAAGGMQITVTNAAAANSMNVFPATGDVINAQSANAAFALPAGKTAQFSSATPGFFHAVLSA